MAILGAVAGLAACSSLGSVGQSFSSVESWVKPYKIDIIQGNFVSREQAASLKPGMPRSQVRDLLGTSLMASAFHAERWDYVFTFKGQGKAPQQRRLTVFFKNDLMDRVESDELPSEAEFVASLEPKKRNSKAPVLQASEESLKDFAEKNAVSAAQALPAVPPISNYPPLEPPPAH
jgi:outer membrane protein assembly factor BamE